MKKLSIVVAILMGSLLFTSCQNPNNASSGNNSGSGNEENGNDGNEVDVNNTVTFDDCTTVITKEQILLSDGNWNLKWISKFGLANVQIFDFITSASDGDFSLISGTKKITIDLVEYLTEEELVTFNHSNQAQKEQILAGIGGSPIPEGASIIFNGTKCTITYTPSADELITTKNNYNFNSFPADAEIKTNSDKTKFTIIYSIDMGSYINYNFYYLNKL